MKRELRETADGSMTIYLPEMDEHYHSYHGALQEAIHVFIKNGISCFADKFSTIQEISVFELGFGTGLNALLTALWANDNNRKVNYFGLEAFPVEAEMNLQMNYHNLISNDLATVYFTKIIEAEWEKSVMISEKFQIQKVEESIQNLSVSDQFDVVFFDAFGPRAQEEMWEFSVLEKTIKLLKSDGLFVTYCAKGQLKRDLKSLGFIVESLPGPPGKREMTRGWKGN
jgi:tRNA U34 5-methylaminomethyl-2-thiouridine-forming methyltransferase MnmC